MGKRRQYSQEEKEAYFAQLRAQWAAAKLMAEGNEEIDQLYRHIIRQGVESASHANIVLVLQQAQAAGLDGLPYLDFKDYRGWRSSGFQVRRGETSQVHAITWIGSRDKQEEGEADDTQKQAKRRWPKLVHLFHRSQVDPAAGG